MNSLHTPPSEGRPLFSEQMNLGTWALAKVDSTSDPCDELSDMTTCIPKQNCAHRLLSTVCSEKVGGGGGGSVHRMLCIEWS